MSSRKRARFETSERSKESHKQDEIFDIINKENSQRTNTENVISSSKNEVDNADGNASSGKEEVDLSQNDVSTEDSKNALAPNTSNDTTHEEPQCGICLDKPDLQGILNSCAHVFCYTCIKQWSKTANTCPFCKQRFKNITKKDFSNPTKKFKKEYIRNRDQRVEDNIPPPQWLLWEDDEDDEEWDEEDDYQYDDFIVPDDEVEMEEVRYLTGFDGQGREIIYLDGDGAYNDFYGSNSSGDEIIDLTNEPIIIEDEEDDDDVPLSLRIVESRTESTSNSNSPNRSSTSSRSSSTRSRSNRTPERNRGSLRERSTSLGERRQRREARSNNDRRRRRDFEILPGEESRGNRREELQPSLNVTVRDTEPTRRRVRQRLE